MHRCPPFLCVCVCVCSRSRNLLVSASLMRFVLFSSYVQMKETDEKTCDVREKKAEKAALRVCFAIGFAVTAASFQTDAKTKPVRYAPFDVSCLVILFRSTRPHGDVREPPCMCSH